MTCWIMYFNAEFYDKSESALNNGGIFSFHTKKSKWKMAGGGSYLPVYTVGNVSHKI
jgi:hypothetical protein